MIFRVILGQPSYNDHLLVKKIIGINSESVVNHVMLPALFTCLLALLDALSRRRLAVDKLAILRFILLSRRASTSAASLFAR